MGDLNKRFPVYSRLLKLYPASQCERYGEEILLTLADMLDADTSRSHRLLVWFRAGLDLPVSLTAQRLRHTSIVLAHETPAFVRRNSCISTLLFTPFIVIVALNDWTAHSFYHTWLWSSYVFLTWIVVLPTMAILISATTLFFWVRTNRRPRLRSLRDFSHNWMMLLPMAAGVCIFLVLLAHR